MVAQSASTLEVILLPFFSLLLPNFISLVFAELQDTGFGKQKTYAKNYRAI